MYFEPEFASFKTNWKLDKSVKANTEIYLDEALFYSDGYKLIVTR